MRLTVYAPFLLAVMFGLLAPGMARRLPPCIGTWILSIGGLLAALGTTAALALLAFTLVGQYPLLAADGRWSDATLQQADPVAEPIAVTALVLLGLLAGRVALASWRHAVAIRNACLLAASFPESGELAVLDVPDLEAYAVPGRPGRIVVTKGLLRALDVQERRAVLAHERAHLRHRHHLHRALTDLAAHANPALCLLPAAVTLSVERWADESAAAICSRDSVVSALSRTALTASPQPRLGAVLSMATQETVRRVAALQTPVVRLRAWRVLLLTMLLAALAAAVLEAAHDTERLFEIARYAYRYGPR